MPDADFVFSYKTNRGEHSLNAYDASQALYGISRSLSIFAHYVINGKVIKQAPALKGAKIIVVPPRAGSFEFAVRAVETLSDPSVFAGAVAAQLAANALYDLTKMIYSRLSGKPEETKSDLVRSMQEKSPGDLDALSDTVEEDVVRIQRPFIHNVTNIAITGGTTNLIVLDHQTYDFALTKIISKHQEKFTGHITSFNGSTISGRIWIDDEARTVSFSEDKKSTKITPAERKSLSKSLDDWVNRLSGEISLIGYALRSKQGLLKHIFVTDVIDEDDGI